MLTINLAKDGWHAIGKRSKLWVWFGETELPCSRFLYKRPEGQEALPTIRELYDQGKDAKIPDDKLLDLLIDIFFPVRYFQIRDFAKIQKVLGFIGPRGSGKTCSAVHLIIIDWLIRKNYKCYKFLSYLGSLYLEKRYI